MEASSIVNRLESSSFTVSSEQRLEPKDEATQVLIGDLNAMTVLASRQSRSRALALVDAHDEVDKGLWLMVRRRSVRQLVDEDYAEYSTATKDAVDKRAAFVEQARKEMGSD